MVRGDRDRETSVPPRRPRKGRRLPLAIVLAWFGSLAPQAIADEARSEPPPHGRARTEANRSPHRTLNAHSFSPGVEVAWRAEPELENVGFHVYRATRHGTRRRITTRLIAGGALLAKRGTTSGSDRHYRWFDATGRTGDRYWIEDHALTGATRFEGPIVAKSAPPGTRRSSADPRLPSVSGRPSLETPWTPLAPRVADPVSPIDPEVAAWLALRPGLQIGVDREGWVQLPFEDWRAAGLPSDLRNEDLRLFHRGREHALEIAGDDDGKFGPGDAVCFYGLPLDTVTTDIAIYTLTSADPDAPVGVPGGGPPQRIRRVSPSGTSGLPPLSFLSTVELKEETQYFAALRNGATDNFLGPLVTSSSLSRLVAIPHRAASAPEPTTLAVSLQGIGRGDHDVSIQVNGITLGSALFRATDSVTHTIPVPALLASPILEITLTTSGSEDLVFLDSLAVTYPRESVAGNEFFRGTAPGGSSMLLSQAVPGTRLFDVTDPSRVTELAANSVPIPGGPTVAMQWQSPAGTERLWVSVPPGETIAPTSLRVRVPSAWRGESLGGEFVIVAPRVWLAALEPLAELRRAEGLPTVVAAVEDLYDEWNGGAVDPSAIADFLRDGSRQWTHLPRYLLLVGDTTYDPRGRLPGTPPSLLPTRLIDSARVETASDAWFGDLDRDGVAEIAVGRLPFSNPDEVERYVERAITGGLSGHSTQERSRALIVCDDDDTSPFTEAGTRARALLEGAISATLVDRNQVSVTTAQSLIDTELQRGTDLVAYFGPGGTGSWGAEDLLTTARVAALDQEERYPIVIATSGLHGSFHHRLGETLAESWLGAKGGALAIFASTALSNPSPQYELGLAILAELVGGAGERLGDAFLAAQEPADAETRGTTVLLGDPTIRFDP